MPACGFIKASGEACKAIPMKGEGWCYVHHPQYQDRRRRDGRKGGKRGGRGRPVADLTSLKDRLEELAEDVLAGRVDRADAAVVGQLWNYAVRAVAVGLKAKEVEELEARLEELETALEKKRGERGAYEPTG
jgi:glutathione S-transferase